MTTNQLDEAIDGQQQNIHFLSSQALSYNSPNSYYNSFLSNLFTVRNVSFLPPSLFSSNHITQTPFAYNPKACYVL